MKKNTCIQDIEAKLSDLPSKWRTQIATTICNSISSTQTSTCDEFKECEVLTSLSDFTVIGSVISVTYTDENNVQVIRSFDFSNIINSSIDSIDPKCITTQEIWNNSTFSERFQLILNYACELCGGITTTTTTTTTTTSSTTTTTTVDPYNYYLAERSTCSNCSVSIENVVVKFLNGTGVIIGDFYSPVPYSGSLYKITAPTTATTAISLDSSVHNSNCVSLCSEVTTSTTTTTTLSIYDTTLMFSGSNSTSQAGVSVTVGAPNPIIQFKFNQISVPTGLPGNMDVYIGASLFMVVGFPSDYLGQPFSIIDNLGNTYTDVFTNGTINF